MLVKEMTDEKGLNYVITHNFLHFSFGNLICFLNCVMQLVFLFVF